MEISRQGIDPAALGKYIVHFFNLLGDLVIKLPSFHSSIHGPRAPNFVKRSFIA